MASLSIAFFKFDGRNIPDSSVLNGPIPDIELDTQVEQYKTPPHVSSNMRVSIASKSFFDTLNLYVYTLAPSFN